ncbi:MAG: hypothetical protein FJ196_04670 [Gammaproteobacteria bacterium]|nr:hypothetical protein [Gammaproteobacteria bacterium]
MRQLNCIALMTMLIALSGCQLNAPQVDTVRRLLTIGQHTSESFQPYVWSLSMAGTQYTVYAARVWGRRVYFSNDYGMNLVWDGDSFIIIENIPGGFGHYTSGREITPEGREGRWYDQAGFPVRRATCTVPQAWRLSADRFGWRQTCRSEMDGVRVMANHLVEFDEKSTIRKIEAPVFPGGPTIVLRRVSL